MEFTTEELAAIRAEYCKGATDSQFELFISECKARNLRPGPHLVFQLRNAKEYDPDTNSSRYVKKPYWITTIGALRLIAQRTGEYLGQGPEEYIYLDDSGQPTVISQIPLPVKESTTAVREPWAVRVNIYRKGFPNPVVGFARFEAVAAFQKQGDGVALTSMWAKRGPEQTGKCATADGLRKAFPEELSSLYLAEEIKSEEPEVEIHAVAPPPVAVPQPPTAPPVNQTPAVGVEGAQRPGETKVEFHTETVPAVLPEHSGGTLTVKPEPKKRGRKPKETVQLMDETGITDADTAVIGTPSPTPPEDFQKEGQAFAESVSSFTTEEAEAQGLPAPPDPIPSQEELSKLAGRVREFRDVNKLNNESLKQFFLAEGGKTDTRFLTVGDWDKAFKKLDEAKAAGTVKTVLENQDTQQSN